MSIDRGALELLGISRVIEVAACRGSQGRVVYDPKALVEAIRQLLLTQPQPPTPGAAAAAASPGAAAAGGGPTWGGC